MSKFNEVKEIVKKENLLKGHVHTSVGVIDDVFSTSEVMDIIEMMNDGMSVNEIVEAIKKW